MFFGCACWYEITKISVCQERILIKFEFFKCKNESFKCKGSFFFFSWYSQSVTLQNIMELLEEMNMRKRILSFLLASCMVLSLALLATGCSNKAGPLALWDAGKKRDKIVVISTKPSAAD